MTAATQIRKQQSTKARRNQDTKIIQDWLDAHPVVAAPVAKQPETFRIAIVTQVRENYGAHDWDGTGECPQYWKSKGGNEHIVHIGTAAEVIALGSAGIKELVKDVTSQFECDQYWKEYMLDWSIISSNEKTEHEEFREWEAAFRARSLELIAG